MEKRLDWWHWLFATVFLAFGVYTLVTGDWLLRGDPNPTMARVGGAAAVFIALILVAFGLGWIRQDKD